jgi:hypothetical protein
MADLLNGKYSQLLVHYRASLVTPLLSWWIIKTYCCLWNGVIVTSRAEVETTSGFMANVLKVNATRDRIIIDHISFDLNVKPLPLSLEQHQCSYVRPKLKLLPVCWSPYWVSCQPRRYTPLFLIQRCIDYSL